MSTKHYKNYNYIYIVDFVNGETAFVLKIEEYKLFKNQVAVECGKFASIPSFSIITVFQKNPQGWGGRWAGDRCPAPLPPPETSLRTRSVGRLLYIEFQENVSLRKLHLLTLYFPRTRGKNLLLLFFTGEVRWSTSKCITKTRLHWRHTRQIIFRKKKGGLQMSSTRTLLLNDT